MPQLFFRPKYVWFPVHLKGPVIPAPRSQLDICKSILNHSVSYGICTVFISSILRSVHHEHSRLNTKTRTLRKSKTSGVEAGNFSKKLVNTVAADALPALRRQVISSRGIGSVR